MRSISDDLTTRARIRDAAIEIFGRDGFTTGVRTVATAAGVSPGLVNHHFGSKQGLRRECDDHVLAIIRDSKTTALGSAKDAISQLAETDHYASVVAYIVRSFAAGGQLASEMFEHMVADAAANLEQGVASGALKPSRDPDARARFLTRQSVGGLLLYIQMLPEGADFKAAVRELTEEVTLPALELYTEGLFTDDGTLSAYLHRES